MSKNIILVGGFHEIIELCEGNGYNIIGIFDNTLKGKYMGYPILGTDADARSLYENYKHIPLVITPDSPILREKLVCFYKHIGYKFETLISSLANISKYALIGKGLIIQAGVNVSAFSEIADFVKLNTNCNIMHDTIVGRYTTIAPNAVVLGRVNINRSCYIGANSTILPNILIGDYVTVGAGAVVTRNIDSDKIVKGIPAK